MPEFPMMRAATGAEWEGILQPRTGKIWQIARHKSADGETPLFSCQNSIPPPPITTRNFGKERRAGKKTEFRRQKSGNEMLDVGQKVVCINADFDPIVKSLYSALPVKNQIYVIRDSELGIGIGKERVPKVSLKLVGLINPPGPPPACRERGFDSDRFAPLEPDKELSRTRATTPDLIGIPVPTE